MGSLVALVGFIFVVSVTPGPNTMLLWASGASFGFRATLRHVAGTAVGVGTMGLLAAAGLGALFMAVPALVAAMKVGASAYLLYLGYQVAGARVLERGASARPLGIVQAALFQTINPKGWILALGAITTFRPPDLPVLAGSLLVAAIMAIMVLPTQALWAGAGDTLSRLMAGGGARRIVSICLAVLLVLSVVDVWL